MNLQDGHLCSLTEDDILCIDGLIPNGKFNWWFDSKWCHKCHFIGVEFELLKLVAQEIGISENVIKLCPKIIDWRSQFPENGNFFYCWGDTWSGWALSGAHDHVWWALNVSHYTRDKAWFHDLESSIVTAPFLRIQFKVYVAIRFCGTNLPNWILALKMNIKNLAIGLIYMNHKVNP